MRKFFWICIILFVGLATYVLWPMCEKFTPEDLSSFNVSVENRTDRDINFMKVFQKKGDAWYQCKARISRAFFF